MLFDLLSTDSDWIQTAVRVILGVIFFAHGAQKLLGWFGGPGLSVSLRGMRESLGVPAPLALLVIATEFLGGLALVAGLFSRIAAVGIGITMLCAIPLAHGRYGLFLNWFGDRKGDGYEYHLLAIALAAVVVARGSGAVSLDRLLSMWIGA